MAYFDTYSKDISAYTSVHHFLHLIVAKRWCVNEVVIFNIKLADVAEYVVQVLAIGPCATPLRPQEHILEVLTRAIREVANCQAILTCNLQLLGVEQYNSSKAKIWNWSHRMDATVEDGGGLPTVFFASPKRCFLKGVGCDVHHAYKGNDQVSLVWE